MHKATRIRSHIRGNAVSYLALFFALSIGTADATHRGGNNTIDSGDIINGQVRSADVGTDQVRSAEVRDDTRPGGGLAAADLGTASVAGSELATNAIPADGGPTDGSTKLGFGAVDTQEIAEDAVGSREIGTQAVRASELGTVTTVERTVSVPPDGGVGSVAATCPEDWKVMGGGAYFAFPSGEISASRRVFGSPTWFAEGQNNGNVAQDLTVQALCLT